MDSDMQRLFIIGFCGNLDDMEPDERRSALHACGKVCADSFPRAQYLAAAESADEAGFLRALSERIPVASFRRLDAPHTYEVLYTRCLCDLTGEHGQTSPAMCECSRYSLHVCWEAVAGRGRVNVHKRASILAGDAVCRFEVRIRPGAETAACLR